MFEELRLVSAAEVLSRASSLLVIPLLTRALQPTGFGVYKSVFLVISLFLTLQGLLSVKQVLIKHLPERSERHRAGIVSAAFLVMYPLVGLAFVALTVVSGTAFFVDQYPELSQWLVDHKPLVGILFLLIPSFGVGLTLARAVDRFRIFAFAKSVRTVAFATVVGVLFVSGTLTLELALWSYAGVTTVGLLVLAFGLRDMYMSFPDFRGLANQLRRISLPLVPNTAVKQFSEPVPRAVILAAFGPTVFAAWTVLFTFSSVFTLLSRPLTNVLGPRIHQRIANDDPVRDHLIQYYRTVSVLTAPAVVGGGLLAPDIVRHVFGPEYFLSTSIVVLVLATLAIQVVDALRGTMFVATDRAIYASYSRVLTVALQLGVVLLGAFVVESILVVAFGYFLRYVVAFSIALWYQNRIIGLPVPKPGTVGPVVFSISALAAVVLLGRSFVTRIPSLFALVLSGAIVYFLSLYLTGFVTNRDIIFARRLVGS